MMQALAKVGFHQSYTYFTWRNTREEVESYLAELAHETAHFMRPNFFVNTPDILHEFLQHGGPAGLPDPGGARRDRVAELGRLRRLRALRADGAASRAARSTSTRRSTSSGSATGRPPRRRAGSLAPFLTRLNEIRRAHPALQQLRNLTVHHSEDANVVVFSKGRVTPGSTTGDGTTPPRPDPTADHVEGDAVIVVVNLDPHEAHATMVHLDLAALGLPQDASFDVHDELTDQTWLWRPDNYVRLDPAVEVAHILTVRSRV